MDFYKVPMGFGMALTRNFNAMNVYSAMTQEQKQALLERVRNAKSESEMSEIVNGIAAGKMR